jgi:hypothetical protein
VSHWDLKEVGIGSGKLVGYILRHYSHLETIKGGKIDGKKYRVKT